MFAFLFLQARGGFGGPIWMLAAVASSAASIGIAGVGTLLATMSVNTKGQDFILAVMFIPLMYPLLTGGRRGHDGRHPRRSDGGARVLAVDGVDRRL